MSKLFMFAAKDGKLAGAVMQSEQAGDERRHERKTINIDGLVKSPDGHPER
jgi:hypothetical protein